MRYVITWLVDTVQLYWDGLAAEIVIDRPDASNAISRGVMGELEAVLTEVEDSEAKVVVLHGGGERVFISGGDLKDLATVRSLEDARLMSQQMRGLLDRLAALPIPVIAAVNGHAFGGAARWPWPATSG